MHTIDTQAAIGFVLSQTSHIETTVNEIKRPQIQYQNLVPVDTSAGAFAKTVTYFSSDQFGKAEWMNGNADDMPMAGTEKSKFEVDIYTASIGYGYGFEEIEHAKALGKSLPNDDAKAARRAYEEFVDELALFGDATKGFEGLLTSSIVDDASALTGDWATATEQQILADVNAALLGVGTGTNFVAMANTLLLPYEKYNYLATTLLGDNAAAGTILTFLMKHNTYTAMTGNPLMIRAVRRMGDIGTGSTARMLAYNRDPETVKMHIPMPHRFLAPREKGIFSVVVPGVFRVGGVDWRLPKEARYVDGI